MAAATSDVVKLGSRIKRYFRGVQNLKVMMFEIRRQRKYVSSELLSLYEKDLRFYLSDALDAVEGFRSFDQPPWDEDSEKWVEMKHKEAYEDYDDLMKSIEETRRTLGHIQSTEDRASDATEQQVVMGLPHVAANENSDDGHEDLILSSNAKLSEPVDVNKQPSDHASAVNVHQACELKSTSIVTASVAVNREHQLMQEAMVNNLCILPDNQSSSEAQSERSVSPEAHHCMDKCDNGQEKRPPMKVQQAEDLSGGVRQAVFHQMSNHSEQPRSSSVQRSSCTSPEGEASRDRQQVSTVQQVASQWKSLMTKESVFVFKGPSHARSMCKERFHTLQMHRSVVPVNGLHLRVRRRLACSVRSSSGTKCHRKVKRLVNCQCPISIFRPRVSKKQIPANGPDLTVAATLPIAAIRRADVHRARVKFKRRMYFKTVPVRLKAGLMSCNATSFITDDARTLMKEDVLRPKWKTCSQMSKVTLINVKKGSTSLGQGEAVSHSKKAPSVFVINLDEANVKSRALQRRVWPNRSFVTDQEADRVQEVAARATIVVAEATESELQDPASGKKLVVKDSLSSVCLDSHTGLPAGEERFNPHVDVVVTEANQCDRGGGEIVRTVRPTVVKEDGLMSSSEFKSALDDRKGQLDHHSPEGCHSPAVHRQQDVSADSSLLNSPFMSRTPVEGLTFPKGATCHASRSPVVGKENLSTQYSSCWSPGIETGPPAGAVAFMVAVANQEECNYGLDDSNDSKEEGGPEMDARSKTAVIATYVGGNVKRHSNAKVSCLSRSSRCVCGIIVQELKFKAVRSSRVRQPRQVFDRGRHRKTRWLSPSHRCHVESSTPHSGSRLQSGLPTRSRVIY